MSGEDAIIIKSFGVVVRGGKAAPVDQFIGPPAI
jgi:hypothetical protein